MDAGDGDPGEVGVGFVDFEGFESVPIGGEDEGVLGGALGG